ncbi:MAG TPA: tetratricopeptide repeat protein, partial [Bryobacteraceae bacterium]|nr:tetratricopeptide repeat protein [Bryobacteraceae bacterium]
MKFVLALLLGITASWAQTASSGTAAYNRANVLFEKQQFDAALSELDAALRADPQLVPALTLKAKLAMAINRYDVARECLDRALAADPSGAYPQFLLGFLFYRQDKMPDAERELQKAEKLNPSDPRSALYLGLTEETLGRTADALAQYERAMRLEEAGGHANAEPWLACARLLMVEGDLDRAGKLLAGAAQIEPNSRDVQFETARLALKKSNSAEAIAAGEKSLRLKGETADRQIHFLLVQAYRMAGRDADAARH